MAAPEATQPLTLIAVPGLSTLGYRERSLLLEICQKHGWDADWLAAAISHESGWRPDAKNPTSSASGIGQWTHLSAKALGTTTEAIRRMSVYEQLPLVEQFYVQASGGRPIAPNDFLTYGIGASACLPDLKPSCILYAAGSQGAKANPLLTDMAGNITVQGMRDELESYALAHSSKPRLPVAIDQEWATSGSPTDKALAAGARLLPLLLLGSLAGTGVVLWARRRYPRRRS